MEEVSDGDLELAKIRFKKLFQKAKQLGLSDKDIRKLDFVQKYQPKKLNVLAILIKWVFYLLVVIALVVVAVYVGIQKGWVEEKQLAEFSTFFTNIDLQSDNCVVPLTDAVLDFFRPPVDCSFCEGINKFDRVEKLSSEVFMEKYAYSGRPVIITDVMTNWTAPRHFSFDFFKKLYKKNSPVLNPDDRKDCQFFPYKTSFQGLIDVFKMPKKMVEMKGDRWYIGWSNCDPDAANKLRKYYQRPYFLSGEMESSRTDWIFMGTPGYGAHIHIDSVDHSSWQAQVHGNKTWTLQPPPECYYKCGGGFKDTVHAGEVIVLDTNKWFHGTHVVGDELSIVIGSEYD